MQYTVTWLDIFGHLEHTETFESLQAALQWVLEDSETWVPVGETQRFEIRQDEDTITMTSTVGIERREYVLKQTG